MLRFLEAKTLKRKLFISDNQSLPIFVTNMHLFFTKLWKSNVLLTQNGGVSSMHWNVAQWIISHTIFIGKNSIYLFVVMKYMYLVLYPTKIFILVFWFIQGTSRCNNTTLLVLKGTGKQCDNQEILSSGNATMHYILNEHHFEEKNNSHVREEDKPLFLFYLG